MLYLVHHGRTLAGAGVRAADQELDPAGFDDIWALRESGRLPVGARWFCAPEPTCVATAQLLTEGEVGVLDALRHAGEQSPAEVRERASGVVLALRAEEPDADLVLIGHPSVWATLGMPDAIEVVLPVASG